MFYQFDVEKSKIVDHSYKQINFMNLKKNYHKFCEFNILKKFKQYAMKYTYRKKSKLSNNPFSRSLQIPFILIIYPIVPCLLIPNPIYIPRKSEKLTKSSLSPPVIQFPKIFIPLSLLPYQLSGCF